MINMSGVTEVASSQHGLVTRQQLLVLGIHPTSILRLVGHGLLERAGHGVYALPASPATFERRALAVCLARPGAAVSHRSAMVLWGLWDAEPRTIDVVDVGGSTRSGPDATVHRTTLVDPADFTRHRRIPVTTVERTLVDCSGIVDLSVLVQAMDDAERRGLLDRDALERCRSAIGSGRTRSLRSVARASAVRAGRGPGASAPEVSLLALIRRAGLPEPVQNHRLVVGGRRFELDLAWPDRMIAVEYDGWDTHRSRSSFNHDRDKDRILVAAGWTVLRVTASTDRMALIAQLRAVLQRSSA